MFAKVKILGSEKHSLFAALTAGGADVGWNFEKFLLGKDGKLIARYASDAEPEGAEIEDAVKKELGQH
jgi:glutathione peroxidase